MASPCFFLLIAADELVIFRTVNDAGFKESVQLFDIVIVEGLIAIIGDLVDTVMSMVFLLREASLCAG